MKEARSRLIVAVDLPDRDSAIPLVSRLSGHVGYFKLGLEIFIREGPRLVQEIVGMGEQVFLDLKLHDIPNTVSSAVRSACSLGVAMLTLHAAGGRKMMEAARESAQSSPSPPLLLAVTALTSLTSDDMLDQGIQDPLAVWAERLADLSYEAGIPGLVASAHELPALRRKFNGKTQFVVPGIRPLGAPSQDQARTASPADAIRAGADFLVVGRPILQSPDPTLAADRIVEQMTGALLLTDKD